MKFEENREQNLGLGGGVGYHVNIKGVQRPVGN